MSDIEPIKISTLKQFKWYAIDSYIEHLAEIGDNRVSKEEPTEAAKKGTKIHGKEFGLIVTSKTETPDDKALEIAQNENVVATNYNNYQIQGAPDEVENIRNSNYRIKELKTTTFDDKNWFKKYSIPPSEFQANLYTWMLDVRDIPIEDPLIVVKKQEDPEEEWFTYECSYDRQDVENELDFIFDKFENPKKLEQYKPDEWKCKNKSHWNQYKKIMSGEEVTQSDSNNIHFYQWEIKQEDMAVVYSENLEVDQEFDMSREGKKYKMNVFRLIDDIPEYIQNDLDGDYDLGLAQALEVKSYE